MTTSNNNKVILVGGFIETIELCLVAGKEIVGIIDKKLSGSYYGIPVLGSDDEAPKLHRKYGEVPIAFGLGYPADRSRLAEYYRKVGFTFANLVHPKTLISAYATVGIGCIIQSGACISAGAVVGDFVLVNIAATIMHEAIIGAHSTIAAAATVLGRAVVEHNALIGSNATILPNIRIGHGAVVGAGAVVTKHVREGVTVVGNPARELERPLVGLSAV